MTKAKQAEQHRRDMARKAVTPVIATEQPTLGDNYDVDVLERHQSVRDLLLDRASRSRFLDEVVRRTLERIEEERARWDALPGVKVSRVVMDGADPAGASRPFGQSLLPPAALRFAARLACHGSSPACPLPCCARHNAQGGCERVGH
eukprot:724726-Prymnesium_polylepis.1